MELARVRLSEGGTPRHTMPVTKLLPSSIPTKRGVAVDADVIVLGSGIVGVSTAIHLARRGRSVVLVDRQEPGRETSFGNGGIIQSEGMRPFRFPREPAALLRIAGNRATAARYDPRALPGLAGALARFWWHSAPGRYARIVDDYATLIRYSAAEHEDLIAASGAEALISRVGWIKFYRSERSWETAAKEADRLAADFGVRHVKLGAGQFGEQEPDLQLNPAGAVHWPDSISVNEPGALIDAYVAYFRQLGGSVALGDAETLDDGGEGSWTVTTQDGPVRATDAVLALGPWAARATRRLGYRLPLFVKRGYHMHYALAPGTRLRHTLVDADEGYLIAPMQAGARLATGAEFAALDAPPTSFQLDQAERAARLIMPLRQRLNQRIWMGSRPCTPDMKPVIGRAPRHDGLWFAFGHGHHGLTLGPVTGRLLAEQMVGECPFVDLGPFSPTRF